MNADMQLSKLKTSTKEQIHMDNDLNKIHELKDKEALSLLTLVTPYRKECEQEILFCSRKKISFFKNGLSF